MSAGVAPIVTVTSWSTGTATCDATLSLKSSAERTRPSRSSSSSPSAWLSATMCATSSAVNALVISFLGSMRNTTRTRPLAIHSMIRTSARSARETKRSGGTRSSAARSGPAMARFLGIISPMTTWR